MENDKKLRVAAYVRISVETKETHHSLYAQEDFYRRKIHENKQCWREFIKTTGSPEQI